MKVKIINTDGIEINVELYNSMFEYVRDLDLSDLDIVGVARESPFVSAVKPSNRSDFVVNGNDKIQYEGKTYVYVDYDDIQISHYLLESALYEQVFLIYAEFAEGEYITDGVAYETFDSAVLDMKEIF